MGAAKLCAILRSIHYITLGIGHTLLKENIAPTYLGQFQDSPTLVLPLFLYTRSLCFSCQILTSNFDQQNMDYMS